jgi:hypothetical protein
MPKKLPDELSFWGNDDPLIMNYELPLLQGKESSDRRDKAWPGTPPSMSVLEKELRHSSAAFAIAKERDGNWVIDILCGRFLVSGKFQHNNEGALRLYLGGIAYAKRERQLKLIAEGTRIQFKSIRILDGSAFKDWEEKGANKNLYKSGKYAKTLLDGLRQRQKTTIDEAEYEEDAAAVRSLTEQESRYIQMLTTYVEVEYELENLQKEQEGSFAYTTVVLEASRWKRQFFRFTLVAADCERLRKTETPSFLRVGPIEDKGPLAKLEDLYAGENEILVSFDQQIETKAIPEQGDFYLAAPETLKKVRLDVLEALKARETKNPWLLELLSDVYEHPYPTEPSIITKPENLNPAQQDAFVKSLVNPDYTLVLGPPGTGKTSVIGEMVKNMVDKGRVLITSQNNKAVDNVLERLKKQEGLVCVRVGSEGKVMETVKDLLLENVAPQLQETIAASVKQQHRALQEGIIYLKSIDENMASVGLIGSSIWTLAQKMIKLSSQKAKRIEESVHYSGRWMTFFQQRAILAFERSARALNLSMQPNWQRKPWMLPICFGYRLFSFWHKFSERTNGYFYGFFHKHVEKKLSQLASVRQDIASLKTELDLEKEKLEQALPKPPLEDVFFRIRSADFERFNLRDIRKQLKDNLNRLPQIEQIVLEWLGILEHASQTTMVDMALELADIVGGTCIGINTREIFKKIPFETVIVDESGQIQIHNLIVPLSRAPKAVLVGDHKQLPPVVSQEVNDELDQREMEKEHMQKSWFEIIWSKAHVTRKAELDTQYRCPAVISDFISTSFYENRYYPGKGMREKTPLLSFASSPMVFIDTSAHARRFERSIQKDGRDEVQGNALETRIVIALIEKALEEIDSSNPEALGIIVAYKNHTEEIKKTIKQYIRKNSGDIATSPLEGISSRLDDVVATLDSFQGQERDLVIMPFTRSNPRGSIGFLKEARRLNVAMTRAKRQLVLVGDFSTLTKRTSRTPHDKDESFFKQTMHELSNYVKKNGQYIDLCAPPQTPDWIWLQEIANER